MHDYKPNLGTIKMLSSILANTFVLSTKIWNFHVNYIGSDFLVIHPELCEFKDSLYEDVDKLAEQIRKLCAISPFSLDEFKKLSVIKESPTKLMTNQEVFTSICDDLCLLDSGIDKAMSLLNDDLVTQNLLIELRTSHDKMKWQARASLNKM